jgi:hypothetical protein
MAYGRDNDPDKEGNDNMEIILAFLGLGIPIVLFSESGRLFGNKR